MFTVQEPCWRPLYPITNLQWLKKGKKSCYSNDRSRVASTVGLCLGAMPPTCVGCFERCVFLLLGPPLETFYAFYAFWSNFSHANVKPLCVHGARVMPAPLYPITCSQ